MTQAARIIESIPASLQPDLAAIKAKLKAAWEDGDYANFATHMEPGAVEILEGWSIASGQLLLDVGCGAGQTALPAARRGLHVTGKFARVVRPGGKLFMANWTPYGMPAMMFKCLAAYMPPPQGFIPPVLWGDEDTVRQRLDDHFTDIRLTRKTYPQWHYSYTPAELVGFFRCYFGPVKRTFEAVDQQAQKRLSQELEQIYADSSETLNGILTITAGEYLKVVATRR